MCKTENISTRRKESRVQRVLCATSLGVGKNAIFRDKSIRGSTTSHHWPGSDLLLTLPPAIFSGGLNALLSFDWFPISPECRNSSSQMRKRKLKFKRSHLRRHLTDREICLSYIGTISGSNISEIYSKRIDRQRRGCPCEGVLESS